jgi:hypothetical protein
MRRLATWQRLVRAMFLPLLLGLPSLFFVADATRRASLTALGRDQGIFQYIAWAVGQGQVDYRDIRDVNGPLVHLVHLVFLHLGGGDEHRFRVLDLACSAVAFAVFGACLPGIGDRNRPRRRRLRPPEVLARVLWAFAAWVVLSAQYLSYLAWDLAQRESFCDWFVLAGLGLGLAGQRAMRHVDPRRRAMGVLLVAGSAACSCAAPFGKPTFALFTLAQLLALLVDDLPLVSRRRRFVIFTVGGIAGALVPLGYLFVYGDARAFWHITSVDVPTLYRFIWPRMPVEVFGMYPHFGMLATLALVTSLIALKLVADRHMPRRAIAVVFAPLLGVVSMALQMKGFPYHFHPMTAGLYAEWLLIACWLGERMRHVGRRHLLQRFVPMMAGAALAVDVASTLQASPHLGNLWILDKGRDAKARTEAEYLVYFQTADFFPIELRQAGAWIQEHTTPADRVQTYGMDPYLLFFAQRLSATPYIYAYDLNVDAALAGDELPEGLHPTEEQDWRIRLLAKAHEQDLLTRLQKAPPKLFVFLDKAPLITWQDAHEDFGERVPEAAAWVDAHYTEVQSFGTVRIWERKDEGPSASGG